jgi:CRP-like cAMP-binding protein
VCLVPETYDQYYTICHHGDIGYKMYFVCKGSLTIFVPKQTHEIKEDKRYYNMIRSEILDDKRYKDKQWNEAKARQTLSEYFAPSKIEIFAANYFFDEQFRFIMTHWWKFRTYYTDLLPTLALGYPKKYWLKGFTFKKICNVGHNFSFGELALINDSPRAATIVCNEYAELLSLNKKDFGQIFAAILATEEEKNIFFMEFFAKRITHSEIIDILYKFESEIYHRGQTIFKEGDLVDYIFIMATGQIQVSSNVKSPPTKPKVGKPKPAPPKTVPLEIITGQTFFGDDDFF